MTFDLSWLSPDHLEQWQQAVQQYGYGVVFLGILVENMGVPLPGETITLTAGFLAGHGQLSYWGVWLAAVGGAIVGDSFGYWVGLRGGWPLLVKVGHWFQISDEALGRVQDEFQQNAGKAVLLGRFLTLLRIFAGPLAGIAGMPYPKFLLLNALGALSWGTTMVTVAFVAGQALTLEALIETVTRWALVPLVIFVGWILVARWSNTHPEVGS